MIPFFDNHQILGKITKTKGKRQTQIIARFHGQIKPSTSNKRKLR